MNPQGTPTTSGVLRKVASSRIGRLQREYLEDQSQAIATLAQLRRCDPARTGKHPEVWTITLGNLPDELTYYGDRRSDEPTTAERALHATLVLFALHQQSQSEGVHQIGVTFGRAVGRLARARAVDEELDSSTVARLKQAALANTPSGRLRHVQALVKLMRGEKPPIGFDYGLLATDLWQLFDRYRDDAPVLLRWARDLHERPKKTTADHPEESK